MLTIRREQMQVLASARRRGLAGPIAEHLAATYPDLCRKLEPPALRAIVVDGLDAAARHGFDDERSSLTLVTLMLLYGPRFERSLDPAWAQAILADARLPGAVKAEALQDRLLAQSEGRAVVAVPDHRRA